MKLKIFSNKIMHITMQCTQHVSGEITPPSNKLNRQMKSTWNLPARNVRKRRTTNRS